MKCAVLALAAMVCGILPAAAQRQTAGRHSVEAYGAYAGGYGGGIGWSNYNYGGRVVWGLDVVGARVGLHYDANYASDGTTQIADAIDADLGAVDAVVTGGYLFRVWAPRSRVVILSAGGALGMGIRYCKRIGEYEKDPYSVSSDHAKYSRTGLLINFLPEVQLEVFPLKSMSLFVSARPHVTVFTTLGGKVDWFRMGCNAGLKYYL